MFRACFTNVKRVGRVEPGVPRGTLRARRGTVAYARCRPSLTGEVRVREGTLASRNHYLDHLAAVPLFAACSRRDLQRIARASDQTTLEAGRVLVHQGDVGRECFIVLEGKVKVERGGRKIATLGPGACIGELALLDKGPRTATVVAQTPLTVLVLGPREFSGVLDEVPGLAHKLLAALAATVRELDKTAYG